MADYYPLLARALEALPDRSPALRKAVYDRARSALIGQLRSLDPPVAESDIDLEREALDHAIARLEVDFGGAPPPAREVAKPPPPVAKAPPPPVVEPPAAKPPPRPEPAPPSPPPSPEATPLPSAQPLDLSKVPEPRADAGPVPEFVPFVPPPRKAKSEPPPPPPEDVVEAPQPEPVEQVASPDPAGATRRPRIAVVAPRGGRSRLLRNVFVGGVLAVVIGLIAVAAFMLRDRPAELPQGAENQSGTQSEQPDSKFADRIGGERAEPKPRAPAADASPQPDLTVAQKAILYEENISDPKAQPKATTGRAIWRVEPVNGEQGQPLQSAVRAMIEFPDAGLSLTMTIRKNLDATLPASHTIELAFSSNTEGDTRLVQEVGLLQLKDEQNGRGSPVSGLPVRVRDNLFLIGLSNLPGDVERNTDLLTHRQWLDLALKFKSGQRAVISFDKGSSGSQVLQSAFDQWRE